MEYDFETPSFHWVDYLVFALSIAASAAIGFYFGCAGKKKQSTADQLVAGRSMSAVPVALSGLASLVSAIFIIGVPAETYMFGPMYSTLIFGFILCIPITAFGYLPTLYNMKITSAYEYIQKRFNRPVQTTSSLLFFVMLMLYMAVSIYTPAVAFSKVTGLPEIITILGIGVVCTVYTSVGGMKAVVWSDVLQMVIIFIGLIIIVTKTTIDSGGTTAVFDTCRAGGRLDFTSVSANPTVRHTWWSQIFGGCVIGMTQLTSNQAMIQRYISVKSLTQAKLCLMYMLATVIAMMGLVTALGWAMYAYFVDCDPVTTGQISRSDQLVALLMMRVLAGWYGIPGLIASAVFAATLSTMSSGVNALAAVTLIDLVQPLYFRIRGFYIKENISAILTKILAGVIGMVCVGLAYLVPFMGDYVITIAYSLNGMIGGPLLALFTMAIFMPCVNAWGALTGMIMSLIITSWVTIGTIASNLRPTPLPLRHDGCPLRNTSIFNSSYDITTLSDMTSAYVTTEFLTTSDLNLMTTKAPDDGVSVNDIYELSYMWYGVLSMIVAIIISIPASYLTGGNDKRDPKFYFDYASLLCWRKKDKDSKPSDDDDNYSTAGNGIPNGKLSANGIKDAKEKEANGVVANGQVASAKCKNPSNGTLVASGPEIVFTVSDGGGYSKLASPAEKQANGVANRGFEPDFILISTPL